MIKCIFSTCDEYADLWSNYFELVEKYWPENQLEFYTSSESLPIIINGKTISSPINYKRPIEYWSNRIIDILKSIDDEIVFFAIDDFYLKSAVNNKIFNSALNILRKDKKIGCINFEWYRKSVKKKPYNDEFKIMKNNKFKITAQYSLWNKKYLLKILRKNENPWEFENFGSFRSRFLKGKVLTLNGSENKVFDYDMGWVIVHGIICKNYSQYFEENEKFEFDKKRKALSKNEIEDLHKKNKPLYLKFYYCLKMVFSIFKGK